MAVEVPYQNCVLGLIQERRLFGDLFIRPFTFGDIPEGPNSSIVPSVSISDGSRVTLKKPPVDEFNFIMAHLIGMSVEMGNLFGELFGIFDLTGDPLKLFPVVN